MRRSPLVHFFNILAALSLAVAGCSRPETARRLARADTLVQTQRYADALGEARQILDGETRDPRANHIAGVASIGLGQYAQAYSHLLKAQARAPNDTRILNELGLLHLLFGREQEAHDVAMAALQHDSLSVRAAVVLAATATTQHEVEDAARRLRSLESRFEDDPSPRLALASLTQRGSSVPASSAEQPAQAGSSSVEPFSHLLAGQRHEARKLLRRQLEQNPDDPSARRALVELLLASDSGAAAEVTVAPLLAKDTADLEARIQRGRAFMLQGKLNEAVRDYRQAQSTAPKLAPIYYYLGAAFGRLSRDAEAIALLDTAIKLTGNYPEGVADRAVIHVRNQIPRASISDAERQLRINPWSLTAMRALGDVLIAAKREAEAVETFRMAVQLAPDRAEPHYWLGVSLARSKNTRAEGVRELETALRLAPKLIDPLSQLVQLDIAEGESDVALKRVKDQIRLFPQSASLQFMLARVHERRNEVAEAGAAFARVVELDPTRVDARVRLIESAINRSAFDDAIAQGEAARKIDPKHTGALTALGLAYQLKGDVEKARQAYEQALVASPNYVPAANNLALLLSESNVDQTAAAQHAATALKGAPNDPQIKDTAGWVLYRAGEYSEAFKLLSESALALPKNLEIQYHLGMAAQKVGDTATARQALRKAAESPANFRGKDDARKALAIMK